MKKHTKGLLGISLGALILPTALVMPTTVSAQSVIYCCNDAQGRKVCGDFLPKECSKRAYEERDGKGFVIKQIEAPLTAEQQAKREAELAKKTELAQKQLEERRRSQALLSTYASEADIDRARDRALADVDKSIAQAEKALADAVKRQRGLEKEKEFYAGKPLPAQLKQQVADTEKDIKGKTDAAANRQKDKERIATDFENEKARFRELTSGGGVVGVKAEDKPKREVIVETTQPAVVAATPVPAATPVTNPAASAAKPVAPEVGKK